MARLRDRLPPPNSLVTFEAAARHLGFTLAAKELQVTQAAVSRQIQLLEDHLGVALFKRKHRALELTHAGERLRQAVVQGLQQIARAADDIRREETSADVTIASSVTFASYWLMSRIAQYRAHFPEVDIRLVASARTRDLTGSGLDLAIRYGRGGWSGYVSHYLFGNEVFPVCSPLYIERHGPLTQLSDLRRATLLHLAQYDRNWVTWQSWFAAFDLSEVPPHRGLSFDRYMVLIHAAIRGEGVALCGGRLAEDLIRRHELLRPFPDALPSEFSFFLVEPSDRHLRRWVRHFRDWLLAEARIEQHDGAAGAADREPAAATP
jgi:LysR family transcriptional regulator, glycine cleavage system transcriptional activator